MQFAIVLPTFNERENIPHLIQKLTGALEGFCWEAIFVDDDSPDGTADVVAQHAIQHTNIRLIRRIGRRGLASACIEGLLSTQAEFLAVMDADLQHDETVLPEMFARMQQDSLDLVVGTRNAKGGSMGRFRAHRVVLSQMGRAFSRAVCTCDLSDPMSGFFMLRRDFFMEVVQELRGEGFKILLDIVSAAKRPVRWAEVGYTFGVRRHGSSKLNTLVGWDYLVLLVTRGLGQMSRGGVRRVMHLSAACDSDRQRRPSIFNPPRL